MKKIVIAAGTGFLGNALVKYFKSKAENIIVLTRGKTIKTNNIHFIHWDAMTIGSWATQLDNSDVLINMAG